ncbi:MAG: Hpt domain-containing protein [Planctomycetaceae bacterium]|nr:MAG: Hpt domain-containing protein [Planctomycetaceae bacterium]
MAEAEKLRGESMNGPGSLIDWTAALDAAGDDAELLEELVGVFLEESPILMQQIQKGLEVSDSSLVRRASHTLKGSLRIFEASSGVDLAFELEKLGQQGELAGGDDLLEDLQTYMDRVTAELNGYLKR